MSRLRTITRRTFLVGSAAIAGGVAVGFAVYRWPLHNPLRDNLAEGEAALTPYVLIDREGVTIITPRTDVGQGATSVQAALVAEELDVEWGGFRVSPGTPDRVYFNAPVAEEYLPIAATAQGVVADRLRGLARAYARVSGLHVTGGSSTVPDAWEKLRVAGAVARAMLLEAAARDSGIPVNQLRTRAGAVLLPDGRTLAYHTLAATAATLSPPSDVSLKPRAEWTLLGKPMRRLDMVAKCTGTATFGIDLRLDGMRYATVRTNPRLGGTLETFDATDARAARGVLQVVRLSNGFGVIADNTWRAFRAASLVKATWGAADHPPTTEAMFAECERSFTEERRNNRLRDDGDVESELGEPSGSSELPSAAAPLEVTYRIPFLAHAPLEPMNAVVQLDNGTLHIYTATQIPRFAVSAAARISGLDPERVVLHAQIAGGSFGRRLEDDFIRQAVELAVAAPGAPIKMTWTREEDMTHDMPRNLAIARGRGAVRDGQLRAFDLSIAAPSTTASQNGRLGIPTVGPDPSLAKGAWDQPFAVPHYRVTGYRAPDMVPISSWRSVGASGNAFFHECFFDELCAAAGIDPLAERLRLCTDGPSRAVLDAVGALADWGAPLPDGHGRGLAFTHSFGVPVATVVRVHSRPDGLHIEDVALVADVGCVLDPVNLESQLSGGCLWGLGHAMQARLTYADGMIQQTNFHNYLPLRLDQAPPVRVQVLENQPTVRGAGEPGVPPAAPALANAIFAATGQRVRELPLSGSVTFV